MNYFLHYTLYPILAKYKIMYVYISSIACLIIFCFLWLYCIDNQLRKKILFYNAQLIDIQTKEVELLKKKNLIKQLTQQKEDLFVAIRNACQELTTAWQKGTDILNTQAQKHHLKINTIAITKQTTKDMYRKRTLSIALQGTIDQLMHFLESVQEIKHFTLENFCMYIESNNGAKIDCSYVIQKIKTPSTHNKLKG